MDRVAAKDRRDKMIASQVRSACKRYKKKFASTNRAKAKKAKRGTARQVRRKYRMQSRHGITPEQYDAMYSSQKGRCAICRAKKGKQGLRIDHDHKTEVIRGLLCHNCNVLLGLGKENVKILEAAVAYLLEHKMFS